MPKVDVYDDQIFVVLKIARLKNLPNMPELHTLCGYPIVVGVILPICLGLYVRFKELRWL
jgi:hypothetical protein